MDVDLLLLLGAVLSMLLVGILVVRDVQNTLRNELQKKGEGVPEKSEPAR